MKINLQPGSHHQTPALSVDHEDAAAMAPGFIFRFIYMVMMKLGYTVTAPC